MPKRPTITLICDYTGESFEKDRREYNRQVREGKTRFYKDIKTAALANAERKTLKSETRLCSFCSSPFEVRPLAKASHFCSKSCQTKLARANLKSDPLKFSAFQKKASEQSKKAWKEGRLFPKNGSRGQRFPVIETRKCCVCNNEFLHTKSKKRKTCSKKCEHEHAVSIARSNPNCGGETNYKRFYYKEIMFDSSWEVEIAKWMDENKIEWRRSRKLMFWWTDDDGKKRRYYPDFYLPALNIYLDPKNKYLIEKDRKKIERVQSENNIKIVWGLKDTILTHLKNLKV